MEIPLNLYLKPENFINKTQKATIIALTSEKKTSDKTKKSYDSYKLEVFLDDDRNIFYDINFLMLSQIKQIGFILGSNTDNWINKDIIISAEQDKNNDKYYNWIFMSCEEKI